MLLLVFALFFSPPADLTRPVTRYADVTLRWDKGALTVVKVARGQLPQPKTFRRWQGRFEARTFDGEKLLDFVRFDFPLLAAAESSDEMTPEAATFGKKLRAGVTATTSVRLPLPDNTTAATIYDTQTKKSVAVTLAAAPPARPSAGGGSTRK